jgi:hypothetical protein
LTVGGSSSVIGGMPTGKHRTGNTQFGPAIHPQACSL